MIKQEILQSDCCCSIAWYEAQMHGKVELAMGEQDHNRWNLICRVWIYFFQACRLWHLYRCIYFPSPNMQHECLSNPCLLSWGVLRRASIYLCNQKGSRRRLDSVFPICCAVDRLSQLSARPKRQEMDWDQTSQRQLVIQKLRSVPENEDIEK